MRNLTGSARSKKGKTDEQTDPPNDDCKPTNHVTIPPKKATIVAVGAGTLAGMDTQLEHAAQLAPEAGVDEEVGQERRSQQLAQLHAGVVDRGLP